MSNPQNITTPDSAKKIMGPNCILLEEASTIFPCRPNDIFRYEKVPFSPSLLYECSEEGNFVLVPGIHYNQRLTKPLTIWEMKSCFQKDWPNLFAPCKHLDDPEENTFAINTVCFPRWYLIPKKTMDKKEIGRLFEKLEVHQCRGKLGGEPVPWEEEHAIIYIYAWIMFLFLRQEEIFQGMPFVCKDIYQTLHRTRVCLEFRNKQITIFDRPINRSFGTIPVIKPNLQ